MSSLVISICSIVAVFCTARGSFNLLSLPTDLQLRIIGQLDTPSLLRLLDSSESLQAALAPQLTYLDLSHSPVTELQSIFARFPSLKSLTLAKPEIDVALLIPCSGTLQKLVLSGRLLHGELLVQSNFPALTHLDLTLHQPPVGLPSLAWALRKLKLTISADQQLHQLSHLHKLEELDMTYLLTRELDLTRTLVNLYELRRLAVSRPPVEMRSLREHTRLTLPVALLRRLTDMRVQDLHLTNDLLRAELLELLQLSHVRTDLRDLLPSSTTLRVLHLVGEISGIAEHLGEFRSVRSLRLDVVSSQDPELLPFTAMSPLRQLESLTRVEAFKNLSVIPIRFKNACPVDRVHVSGATFSGLTHLQNLELHGVCVGSLSGLEKLRRLHNLTLTTSEGQECPPIQSVATLLELRRSLTHVKIRSSEIDENPFPVLMQLSRSISVSFVADNFSFHREARRLDVRTSFALVTPGDNGFSNLEKLAIVGICVTEELADSFAAAAGTLQSLVLQVNSNENSICAGLDVAALLDSLPVLRSLKMQGYHLEAIVPVLQDFRPRFNWIQAEVLSQTPSLQLEVSDSPSLHLSYVDVDELVLHPDVENFASYAFRIGKLQISPRSSLKQVRLFNGEISSNVASLRLARHIERLNVDAVEVDDVHVLDEFRSRLGVEPGRCSIQLHQLHAKPAKMDARPPPCSSSSVSLSLAFLLLGAAAAVAGGVAAFLALFRFPCFVENEFDRSSFLGYQNGGRAAQNRQQGIRVTEAQLRSVLHSAVSSGSTDPGLHRAAVHSRQPTDRNPAPRQAASGVGRVAGGCDVRGDVRVLQQLPLVRKSQPLPQRHAAAARSPVILT